MFEKGNEIITAINLDQIKNRMMIVQKAIQRNHRSHRHFRHFILYDLDKRKQILKTDIHNQAMIDRFESGSFTFEGGHIYFNNDVIKLRYDIIEKFGGHNLEEKDIFN